MGVTEDSVSTGDWVRPSGWVLSPQACAPQDTETGTEKTCLAPREEAQEEPS